jgi:ribosomal protein S18 acetylase RimI-like enzyme
MSDGTGTPYLGAHVVGQRVVVRRLVPGSTGPTGGPAFTDVLGDCIAWDPCVVVTATGERVEIPLELIVSGKPVPPRPSVRMRASVAECEARVAALWADVVSEDVGGWTLRHSPTVDRRRANSCLALIEPSLPVERALARVRDRYEGLGRAPILAVERDSSVAAACRAAGWLPAGGESRFLLASTSRVLRSVRDGSSEVDLAADGARAGATAGGGAARGHAVLDGDWVAIHDLYVEPARRREGLGRAVLRELVEWGAEQGARTAWLHVEDDNAAATALYETCGFAEHHRMEYLTPAR